ncbi:MAG: transcription factor FapR [Thermanaerothrix sp.]|nr:transcription factor FapR [Thermanaerothrix sp.]
MIPTRSDHRKNRHKVLMDLIKSNPLLTDEELADRLKVSISTVRLDRVILGIPELRERMRLMAEAAGSRLRSLTRDEVVGDLLELEPNVGALSMLEAAPDMAFRGTDRIWDHFIYAQASTLAMATIGAEMVITGSARIRYRYPAVVGDRLLARSKVGIHKGNKYVVSVRTRVKDREIFVGRFIVVSLDQENGL